MLLLGLLLGLALLALPRPLSPWELLTLLLLLGLLALLLVLLLTGLLLLTLPAAAPLMAARALSFGLLLAGGSVGPLLPREYRGDLLEKTECHDRY